MKIININKFQITIYMYKYYHSLLLNYVTEIFSANNTNDAYNTRYGKHNRNIIIYTSKSSRTKNTWNCITTNIQNMSSVMFKQYVKTVLSGEIVVNY